jgi:hypothetical protein
VAVGVTPLATAAMLRAREHAVEAGYQRIVMATRDLVALVGRLSPSIALRIIQTAPEFKEAERALRELGR